jgi:hypothetical protein
MRLIPIAASLVLTIAPTTWAQDRTRHIPFDEVVSVFDQVRTQTKWDLSGDLVWGYFFYGDNKSSVEKIANLLKNKGYRIVELGRQKDETNRDLNVWRLHIERVEHHTPETLFARNDELYALADQVGHVTYDGMDVGPVH